MKNSTYIGLVVGLALVYFAAKNKANVKLKKDYQQKPNVPTVKYDKELTLGDLCRPNVDSLGQPQGIPEFCERNVKKQRGSSDDEITVYCIAPPCPNPLKDNA